MSCEDPDLEKIIERSEKDSTVISSRESDENFGCNINIFGPTEINCSDLPKEINYQATELEEFGSERSIKWYENNDLISIVSLEDDIVTLLFEEGFGSVQLTLRVSKSNVNCSKTITIDCL